MSSRARLIAEALAKQQVEVDGMGVGRLTDRSVHELARRVDESLPAGVVEAPFNTSLTALIAVDPDVDLEEPFREVTAALAGAGYDPHTLWLDRRGSFHVFGDEKVLENRCRRVADRRGMTVQKNRRRDPHAHDYGHYYLTRGEDTETFASLEELANHLGISDAEH